MTQSPLSLQGSAVSSDGSMHIERAPCCFGDVDESFAEKTSVSPSLCPPGIIGHPVDDRFSGGGADAVVSLSVAEPWEPVIDEPWGSVADDEDPLSTTSRSSKPNYTGQQTLPSESLVRDDTCCKYGCSHKFPRKTKPVTSADICPAPAALEKTRKQARSDVP